MSFRLGKLYTETSQPRSRLFYQLTHKTGPGNADALAWHMGKDLEDFNVNFAFGFYGATGNWGAKPHKHGSDQVLAFVGLDDKRPNHLGTETETETARNRKNMLLMPLHSSSVKQRSLMLQ